MTSSAAPELGLPYRAVVLPPTPQPSSEAARAHLSRTIGTPRPNSRSAASCTAAASGSSSTPRLRGPAGGAGPMSCCGARAWPSSSTVKSRGVVFDG